MTAGCTANCCWHRCTRGQRSLPAPIDVRPRAAAIDRRAIGLWAEQRAAEFLETQGATVLWRNYRCRMGELDIVARLGPTLLIAEVRLRSRADYGGAAASITHHKQRRIGRAARHLLACHPALQRLPARFDVLLVSDVRQPIRWLQGAFELI